MNGLTRMWNNLTGRYGYPDYPVPRWRRAVVATAAFLAGVHVKIDGLPYGASRECHLRVKGNQTGRDFGFPPG